MQLDLPHDLTAMLKELMSAGNYDSETEVVGDALQLLKERAAEEEAAFLQLRKDIDEGMADIEAGRVAPFDDAMVERIKAAGRARLGK